MSEILPLLLLPAVAGWWLSEWKQRRARASLRAAISRARRPILPDAGGASVIVVARSLEITEPAARRSCPWWLVGRARTRWEVRALAAPLGLSLVEVIRVQRDRLGRHTGFSGASRFTGVRHGRPVDVRLGADRSTITITLPGAAIAPLTVEPADDGTLTGTGELPPPLAAALHTLTASRHWRGMQITGRGEHIVLGRPASAPGSWLHDLWLTEFVADLVAPAPAPVAAPARAHGVTAQASAADAAAALAVRP